MRCSPATENVIFFQEMSVAISNVAHGALMKTFGTGAVPACLMRNIRPALFCHTIFRTPISDHSTSERFVVSPRREHVETQTEGSPKQTNSYIKEKAKHPICDLIHSERKGRAELCARINLFPIMPLSITRRAADFLPSVPFLRRRIHAQLLQAHNSLRTENFSRHALLRLRKVFAVGMPS